MHHARKTPEELAAMAESALQGAAGQLRLILVELVAQLHPFPAFLNMVSIQAIELEPELRPVQGRGCVVVCPDGEIRQLELTGIPGVPGVSDVEGVEQFHELDLPIGEYIIYATTAIEALLVELRRRGK
ncbi:MAG TPA: hypothetical protein VFA32_02355 [Dehalococcoidia bacterium]|jgi:hypothetical protein|nr:hypothetical protein [Dehalococcoidia bacterium]